MIAIGCDQRANAKYASVSRGIAAKYDALVATLTLKGTAQAILDDSVQSEDSRGQEVRVQMQSWMIATVSMTLLSCV